MFISFNQYCSKNHYLLIWCSFFIVILLQIMPLPYKICLYWPSWITLLLIYWMIRSPNIINVGTSFLLGIIMDILFGSVLGTHSLALSIMSYLIIYQVNILLNDINFWQLIPIVFIILFIINTITYYIEYILINNQFHFMILLYRSIIDTIYWPGLFLLMQQILKHIKNK